MRKVLGGVGMKKINLVFLMCVISFCSYSEEGDVLDTQVATGADGESVILFSDGTWQAMEGVGGVARREYLRSPTTRERFAIGENGVFGVWYSPSFWTVKSPPSSEEYALEFVHSQGGAFAYLLFTKNSTSDKALKSIALRNIYATIDNATILIDKNITVNGLDFQYLKVQGIYFGKPITSLVYTGYYYTGAMGTLQFIVYTTQGLDEDYRCQIQSLLNGLVLQPFKDKDQLDDMEIELAAPKVDVDLENLKGH
jgi:hypothetical protein